MIRRLSNIPLPRLLVLGSFFFGVAMSLLAIESYHRYREQVPFKLVGSDMQANWAEAEKVCRGENPYARMKDSGDEFISRAPVYLPGFYLLGCGLIKLGVRDYPHFLDFWDPALIVLHIVIGFLYWLILVRRGQVLMATFVLTWWLFNRFTLFSSLLSSQLNTLPILFLLIGVLSSDRLPTLAALNIGLSLAFKQLGVFLLPGLILAHYMKNGLLSGIKFTFLILLLPVLVTAPFLYWDHQAFLDAITYSTRRPAINGGFIGYPQFLVNINPQLPMIIMLFLILLVAVGWAWNKIPKYSAAFLTMLSFVSFNQTVFTQYFLWALIFFPLMLLELGKEKEKP